MPNLSNPIIFDQPGSNENEIDDYSNINCPIINIYIMNYPQNTSLCQNYGYFQQQLAQNYPSYLPSNQIQMNQQQPNFFYYNKPFLFSSQSLEAHENSKKDNKKHNKKDHKKKKEKKQKKSKSKHSKDTKKEKSLSFLYTEGNHLKGIINYLTSKTGGNVCDNGTISIQGSSNQPSFLSSVKDARHLCDFTDLSRLSMWSPDNERNANILFDFKDRRIKLTDYSLHTPVEDTSDYPKSWRVDCSNDSFSWTTVDVRDDVDSMNSNNVCNTFKCSDQQNNFYRYIKITSTGPCWNDDSRFYFDVSAVEFFGLLKE